MKNLYLGMLLWAIFITFLIGIEKASAENCFPVGKVGAKTVYTNCSKCETVEGQACFDITGESAEWLEVQTAQVDDMDKPILKPAYGSVACDSDAHCIERIEAGDIACLNGDYRVTEKNSVLPGFTVYCTGVTGYEQKTVTAAVVNEALKTQVQAARAAEQADEAAIQARTKRIGFGVRMIALIGVRNDAKNLTNEQSKTFLTSYGPIMQLLQAGAIDTAKAEIEALTPDGTLTTQADKDAILAEINAFLTQ